jgi:2-phospho-L-lactate guanylyltransferase
MKTFAIVPVKDLDKAKSRLSAHLSKEQRKGLFLSMLDDVLSALSGLPTIVICPEDISSHLSSFGNVRFLLQEGERDLNSAVVQANTFAFSHGVEATLFVPADMPLISSEDVEDVLKMGRNSHAVITKARDGGTGILYRRPPDVMESRFTKSSFPEHQKEAEKKGIDMHIYESFPLSLDIDTIDDLNLFMEHGAGTKTYEHLKRIGL